MSSVVSCVLIIIPLSYIFHKILEVYHQNSSSVLDTTGVNRLTTPVHANFQCCLHDLFTISITSIKILSILEISALIMVYAGSPSVFQSKE